MKFEKADFMIRLFFVFHKLALLRLLKHCQLLFIFGHFCAFLDSAAYSQNNNLL